MKDNILIVDAKQSDYKILREIFYNVRKSTFHWERAENIKLSDFDESTKDELILTAMIENKIVGFISIWVPDKFIHNLFVSKEFQGKGIGTDLIIEAIKRVSLPLTLKCVKSNIAALDYYISHNWIIEEEGISDNIPYYLMKYPNTY
ncbi:GNAT family N-acetyltransferase [Clostridium sp. LBM24168]